uniref:Stc1 domain-containing protein n=1 Tax=Rhizochromulina marina TaxID=1034831 RepID=A0A6U1C738_9STRA|mmetsp:Transcript_6012/g.17559  ORF Transcript_6012/g.17559 Transcript_6012/m.17559 type:complete len:199 (+) Transcript_6012:17-613(+)
MASWAGDFECSRCRRKRLIAAEFSRAQLDKARKAQGGVIPLTCKRCVEADQASERAAAAAQTHAMPAAGEDELHECAACKERLPALRFNKNQLRKKGPGKQRCQACVEAAEASASSAAGDAKREKLAGLRQDAKRAEAVGSAVDKAVAAAAECAAEAELVTGLKPMVLGRGRGRRRGRGSSGRGGLRVLGRGRSGGRK